MLLARGVAKCRDGQERRILTQASVDAMVTPQPLSEGFGSLTQPVVAGYSSYMLQTGLIDVATAAVVKTIYSDAYYGLGVPLTQVENGKARNIVLLGASGQAYMIVNYEKPQNAMFAICSCFQNVPWVASNFVIGVVLAAVLP